MYSAEQRMLAIETYIKFDLSASGTVAELGYPTRHSLRTWYKDYLEHGEVRPLKRQREALACPPEEETACAAFERFRNSLQGYVTLNRVRDERKNRIGRSFS